MQGVFPGCHADAIDITWVGQRLAPRGNWQKVSPCISQQPQEGVTLTQLSLEPSKWLEGTHGSCVRL